MPSHLFCRPMVAAFIASRQGCELQDDEVILNVCKKVWCKNTRIITASNWCNAFRRIIHAGDDRHCYSSAFPQLRPGFDISKPMETRDLLLFACSLLPA